MTLERGTTFGPYEIGPLLGAGGMGEVYRAHDTRLQRDVALKVLPPDLAADEQRERRFDREARLLSKLEHPNVCRLYDVGKEDGVAFLVMELIEGETLRERLRRGPLDESEAIGIATQVAAGLDCAHRKGLVHRDLKPGNVMLTGDVAKILDFGLARPLPFGSDLQETLAAGEADRDALTGDGVVTGTVPYVAPEQLEGGLVDHRSDLFAFGAVLFEMLVGRPAFAGESAASVIAAVLATPPAEIDDETIGLSPKVRYVLQNCLARRPGDRWQSVRDVAIVLGEERDTVNLLSEPSRPSSRNGWRLAAALCLVGIGVGWLLSQSFGRGGRVPHGAFEFADGSDVQLRQQTRLDWVEEMPQISPDGQFFVFSADSDGVGPASSDIYLQRVDGDRPIPLTSGPDLDVTPAFSPDGSTIAFCRVERSLVARAVYTMGATGESPRKVVEGGCYPSWSPDGKQLAYSTNVFWDPRGLALHSDILVLDTESGESTALVTGGGFASQPTWSPDGSRIAYWQVGVRGERSLYAMDLQTRESTRFTTEVRVDWSPFWGTTRREALLLEQRIRGVQSVEPRGYRHDRGLQRRGSTRDAADRRCLEPLVLSRRATDAVCPPARTPPFGRKAHRRLVSAGLFRTCRQWRARRGQPGPLTGWAFDALSWLDHERSLRGGSRDWGTWSA